MQVRGSQCMTLARPSSELRHPLQQQLQPLGRTTLVSHSRRCPLYSASMARAAARAALESITAAATGLDSDSDLLAGRQRPVAQQGSALMHSNRLRHHFRRLDRRPQTTLQLRRRPLRLRKAARVATPSRRMPRVAAALAVQALSATTASPRKAAQATLLKQLNQSGSRLLRTVVQLQLL